MKNKKEDIENLFRDHFTENEFPVSDKVWANIKKTLPKEKNRFGITLKWPRYFGLWLISSLLIIGSIGYVINKQITEQKLITFNLPTSKKSTPNTNTIQNLHDDSLSQTNSKSRKKIVAADQIKNHVSDQTLNQENTKKIDSYELTKKTTPNSVLTRSESNSSDLAKTSAPLTKPQASDPSSSKPFQEPRISIVPITPVDKHNDQRIALNNSTTTKPSGQEPVTEYSSGEENLRLQTEKAIRIAPVNSKSDILEIKEENKNNSYTTSPPVALILEEEVLKENARDKYFSTPFVETEEQSLSENYPINYSSDSTNKMPEENTLNILTTEALNEDARQILVDSSLSKKEALLSKYNLNSSADSLSKAEDTVSTKELLTDIKPEKESATPSKKNMPSPWSIDLLVSPQLTGAITTSTNNSMAGPLIEKNTRDKPLLNIAIGATINYAVHPRVLLSTGVHYGAYSEQSKFNVPARTYYVWVDSIFQERQTGASTITKKDKYSFIELPISISYAVIEKDKWNLFTTAGLRTNLLLNGLTHLKTHDTSNVMQLTKEFNSVTLSCFFSLGLEYKLKNNFSLLAQPSGTYFISSIHKKSVGIRQKPYAIGLNVGIRFRF